MPGGARTQHGAAAGGAAIAVYLVGALVMGTPPDFDAAPERVAAYLEEERTRIQVGAAIQAAWPPLLVWFVATVRSLARGEGEGAERAAMVAFGCALVFVTLFLADVSALAVAALRPESMSAAPELAAALHDFSWLAMGMAAPAGAGVLAAFAVLAVRHDALWPRWLGVCGAVAALLYVLRVGTLFTTDGPFAADGVLGLWVPVSAIAAWIALASALLTRSTWR